MEDNKTTNNIITLSVEEYTKIIKENEEFKVKLEHYTKVPPETAAVEVIQEHVSPQPKKRKGIFQLNE